MTHEQLVAHLRQYLGQPMLVESMVDGKLLGGEGVLTEVRVERDEVWVDVDWGMSWIVRDDQLNVAPAPSAPAPVPEQYR